MIFKTITGNSDRPFIKYPKWSSEGKVIIALILSTGCLFAQANQKYIRLKAGIHIDSKVSGGQYDPIELADIIDKSDLDIAIITDHDNMKVTYGIAPFQNLLKFSIEENSITTFGVEKYFSLINQIDDLYPNVIIIPGVEAVPFYFWEGSLLDKNLRLKNWHTHLLVFGLKSVDDYKHLPSLANGIGFKKPNGKIIQYIAENFLYFATNLLVIILFFISLLCIIRRKKSIIDIAQIHKKFDLYRISWCALFFTIIFGWLLKSEFPFLPRLYDQYHDNPGVGPFQQLINYVNDKNGLIFWAHPEVNHTEERKVNIPFMPQTISISTDSYPQYISESQNYTGYAIFWEGMKVIGKPGGLWDFVLNEYCSGFREKPVWAVGELDFEEGKVLSLVTETNTFIFAKERSREGVYEAFRSGRMYATRGFMGNKLVLEDFSVYDMYTGKSAFIGETLTLSGPPVAIHVQLKALENISSPMTLLLFRGNQCIYRFRFTNFLDEWFVDENLPKEKTYYYRLLLGEEYQTLATNPIFVKK